MAEKSQKHSQFIHKHGHKVRILKKTVAIALAFFIFLFIVAGSFFFYQKAFAQKIYPGISIGGVSVWGMTTGQAQQLVSSEVNKILNNEVIIVINGKESKVKLADLGVKFDTQKLANAAYAIGHTGLLQEKIYNSLITLFKDHKLALNPTFESNQLNDTINKLVGDQATGAKDAYFKIDGDNLVIVSEQSGKSINYDSLKNSIVNLINQNNINQKILVDFKSANANLTESALNSIKSQVNSVISQPIYLLSNSKNITLGKSDILGMLSFTPYLQNQVQIGPNNDAIKTYVDNLADQQIDTVMQPKKVRSDNGDTITEGKDGAALNREKTVNDIKSLLNSRLAGNNSNSNINLEIKTIPKTEQKVQQDTADSSGGTSGVFPGKYLEVVLATQMLYCWDGNSNQCAYRISSGMWSMPTPTGTRYIDSKNPRAYSASYGLYMPWWMSMGGGYGIHELPEWPDGTKEGESHLGIPVSHGCVRLGVGPAEFVYNWTPIGTPVYIH